MEMSIEQQRALALAAARARASGVNVTTPTEEALQPATQDSGFLSGLTEQARQGAGFGFADEVGAAGAGTGGAIVAALRGQNPIDAFSKSYDRRLGEIRGAEHDFRTEHPVSSIAANVAGGLSVAGPTAAKAVSEAPSVLNAMKEGARVGATYGGINGFGSGEGGLENRLFSAGVGGGIGGFLGGAIPAVGYAVGKGAQVVRNMTGMQDPKKQAAMLVARALDRDGVVGPIETGFSVGSDKPVALADLGGQNVKRLADQVNVQGGTGANKIATFLADRQAEQPARIADDIKRSLSSSTDTYGLDTKLSQIRSASNPLWEDAMSKPPIWNDRLAQFADEPAVKSGMAQGVKLARLDALAKGEPFDPKAYAVTGFNEAGDPIIGGVPTWRTWQAAKEGLDAQIADARGPLGQATKQSNALTNVKNALLKELDFTNPSYRAARAAWAGPSAQMDAIDLGGKFMKFDPEQIAAQTSKMAPDELQAFRVGAARNIQDTVDRVRGTGDITKRIFNDARTKAQVGAAFGEDATNAFGKSMEAERKMFDTNSFVAGNSRTAQRMNDAADVGQQVTEDFLMGGKGGVVRGLIERGIARGRGINDATGSELADMLTQTTPEGRARILAEILSQRSAAQTTEKNLLRAGAIANLLATQQAASGLAIKK